MVVNRDSGFGTGQLPDKEGQMYHAEVDDFYLVPTAEVPVTNIFRDVILAADQIPQRLTAYTPCFRREAVLNVFLRVIIDNVAGCAKQS